MRVFVAGGSGVLGVRLMPLLVAAGHDVVAMTRTPAKVEMLRSLGAEPVCGDALDALFEKHDGLRERITEDGDLRRFVNV